MPHTLTLPPAYSYVTTHALAQEIDVRPAPSATGQLDISVRSGQGTITRLRLPAESAVELAAALFEEAGR